MRLFVGYDPREAVGLHVFIQSVLEHTTRPVSITPLSGRSDGTNAFTLARFLIPSMCKFEGTALWMDGADMLVRSDLSELWDMADGSPVQVVKHNYTPKEERKYIGTELEAPNVFYPRKNWSSVMLFNCGHMENRGLTRSFVNSMPGVELHRFCWLSDDEIGELPASWNWLDEYGESDADCIHYTNGIPGFQHYAQAPHADEWRSVLRKSQRGAW